MPKCRVWGCDQHSDKGITTHRFPYKTDLERARRWLILCKIEFGDIKKFNFENLVICGKHFADSAYEEDMQMRLLSLQYPEKYGSSKPRKKLKSDAVPSLHLPSTAHQPKERDTSVNRSRRMERKRVVKATIGHEMSGEIFEHADPDNNEMQQVSHSVDKASTVKSDNIEQGTSNLPDICPMVDKIGAAMHQLNIKMHPNKEDSDLEVDADIMSEDNNAKETQEDNCEEEDGERRLQSNEEQRDQQVGEEQNKSEVEGHGEEENYPVDVLRENMQQQLLRKGVDRQQMTSRFENKNSETFAKDKHEPCKESHDKIQEQAENVDAIAKVHLDKDLSTSQESSSISSATHILDESDPSNLQSIVDEAGKGLQESSPNTDRQLVTGASSSPFQKEGLVEIEECHSIPGSQNILVKLPPTSSQPTEKFYDILIIHSDCAEDLKELKEIKSIGKKNKWKIISVLEFPAGMSKFKIFSTILKRCTYTMLLLTKHFFGNVWNKHRYTASLTAAIENKDRQWSVIPVLYPNSGCEVPLELTTIAGLNREARFFVKNLTKSISTKKRRDQELAKGFESEPSPSSSTSILPEFPAEEKTEIMEDTSHLSAGELYRLLKPELTPTETITKVFKDSDRYRKICDLLDSKNSQGRDHRLLAEMVGFTAGETIILAKEKSPTAKILEVFCLKNKSKPKLEVLNIFLEMVTHLDQQEVKTEVENEIMVAKFSK